MSIWIYDKYVNLFSTGFRYWNVHFFITTSTLARSGTLARVAIELRKRAFCIWKSEYACLKMSVQQEQASFVIETCDTGKY